MILRFLQVVLATLAIFCLLYILTGDIGLALVWSILADVILSVALYK